ncbi:hypothetical protein [Streptomyces lycii]|uniref:Uncharacterized protein n=1 Tax=Streptomyces lycii TaxID=2654337 RepID=A0ABQ7FJ04_9ACTN|nr:hypothetical protein [Streptomyces lycii]KAF4408617.1 hypothetical protein GCU69_13030 [Streptomyces lycii]
MPNDDAENLRTHLGAIIILLAETGSAILFPQYAVALFLEVDEDDLFDWFGHGERVSAEDIVSFDIDTNGEDGLIGETLIARLHARLAAAPE